MCEFAIKPIWIGSAICTIGLCIATPAKAQITLRLSMNPSSVSFPDANPSTTPLVSGGTVRVSLRVRNALPTDNWSVNALAAGDLTSGSDTIPLSNTAWTVTQAGAACNCTCQAGTGSIAVPQLVLIGQGNTGGGVRCRQNYTLINSWAYAPGSYSQIVTITATSP